MSKAYGVIAVLLATSTLSAQDEGFGEWKTLFNGEDLTGWQNAKPRDGHHKGPNRWKVEDGALTNQDRGVNDICTVDEFQDYELEIEYKIREKGNSGVYLRGQIEIQIFDSHWKREKGEELTSADAGAIYGGNFVALANPQNAPGEWNKYRVLHVGSRITVWHNGVLIQDNVYAPKRTGGAMTTHPETAEPLSETPRKGPLMLQGDHERVWYRNIRIRPLMGEGWKPLWNGEDLSEFKSNRDGMKWKVEDNAFTNTAVGGQGHDIWTKESFGNFRCYYAYKSDPSVEGGNSGFYLRDQWEIQILGAQRTDENHHDASLYSCRSPSVMARHEGMRWNHMFVELIGRKISVWQNGKRIHHEIVLDHRTDNHGVPTLEFSKAPFKLQGDHGKVWFTNVWIEELPDDAE